MSKTQVIDWVQEGLLDAHDLALAIGNYMSTDEYAEFVQFLVDEHDLEVEKDDD